MCRNITYSLKGEGDGVLGKGLKIIENLPEGGGGVNIKTWA